LSNFLLFFFRADDNQMCSRVHSAAEHASRLPLKSRLKQVIAEVTMPNIEEVRRTARYCNITWTCPTYTCGRHIWYIIINF